MRLCNFSNVSFRDGKAVRCLSVFVMLAIFLVTLMAEDEVFAKSRPRARGKNVRQSKQYRQTKYRKAKKGKSKKRQTARRKGKPPGAYACANKKLHSTSYNLPHENDPKSWKGYRNFK